MTTKEILETILNYIRAVLSWPPMFVVVSFIFIIKFRDSIKVFLENIATIKMGPLEASQQQKKVTPEKIEEQIAENLQEEGVKLTQEQLKQIEEAFNSLSKEKESKEIEVTNQKEFIQYLLERSELYEFAYLTLFLVHNSKLALLWFYTQPTSTSTKENFMMQFALQTQHFNPAAEKEAIFSALMVNELLEQNGILFKVSEKGVRFLRNIKFIS